VPDPPPPHDCGPPYCVICYMLVGKRACPAVTTVAGDAVCGDHVGLRVESPNLLSAVAVARADLEPRTQRTPTMSLPVHEVRARLLIEPLSEREREVLRYLPSQLTTREIGTRLFVSLNTVKTHQRAIYRKLGVSQRHDAVHRAKQLGLLP
jgi:ATP/maltotriose-dependent transcriptional regulator MalT